MNTTGLTALKRAILILQATKAEFAIVTKNEKGEPVLTKSDHIDTYLLKMIRETKGPISDHVRKHLNFEMEVGEMDFIPDTGANEIEVVRTVALTLAAKAWGAGSAVTTIVNGEQVGAEDKAAKFVEFIRVK
jgi:hypothetical protein